MKRNVNLVTLLIKNESENSAQFVLSKVADCGHVACSLRKRNFLFAPFLKNFPCSYSQAPVSKNF